MHSLISDAQWAKMLVHRAEREASERQSVSKHFSTCFWTPPLGICLEPSSFAIKGMTDEEQAEKQIGIKSDSLEGTEKGHPVGFYVLIVRAGRKWRAQGDWM